VAADVKPAIGHQELSMGWIDPWVGLGWVEFFQYLVGWVGSSIAKVVKCGRIMLVHLKRG